MSGDASIRVEGLVRTFRGGVRAVDGLELNIADGEIYGFLGPNGAGKSTTVQVLTTLLAPTAGRVRVAGFELPREARSVRSVVGAALQEDALDPQMSAWEHMRLQAALHLLAPSEARPRGAELLERMGLADVARRRVATYSGGMRRRLDLALALVNQPRVLFLDEPTTGLDLQSRSALWEEIRWLAGSGTTVFLTTQYLEEADALADRIGIIHRGRLVAEGTPEELKASVGSPTVVVMPQRDADRATVAEVLHGLGEPVPAPRGGVAVRSRDGRHHLPEIVRALDAAGVAVLDVEVHAPSLNDVFLQRTGRTLRDAD